MTIESKPVAPRVATRRQLAFNDLAEVTPEVERLRAGHRTIGNWSLAQICRHLADSFNGSIDGFGVYRHRVMRVFLGRIALRRVFAMNGLDDGFTVTEALNPPHDADIDDSVANLEAAIGRFAAHSERLAIHPFFGRLSRGEWTRLHRIHCAHHLSHAVSCPHAADET